MEFVYLLDFIKKRTTVVREANGTLRYASWTEREQLLHIYYPDDAKSLTKPKMFESDVLEVQ